MQPVLRKWKVKELFLENLAISSKNVEKIVLHTLSLKSLSLLSSVCYKITQTTGGVGVAGACPPTSKLGTFL